MTIFEFNNIDLKIKAERLKYVFDGLNKQKRKFEKISSTRGLKSEEHEQYEIVCSKLNNFNEKCKIFIRPRKNGVGKFSVKDYINWCQNNNNNSPGMEYSSNTSNITNSSNNGISNKYMTRNNEISNEKVFYGYENDNKYKEKFMSNKIHKELGNSYEVFSTSSHDNKSENIKSNDKGIKHENGTFGGINMGREIYGKTYQSPQGYYNGGYRRYRNEEKKKMKIGYPNESMGWEFHNTVGEGDNYYYRMGNYGMMNDNEYYSGKDMDKIGYGKQYINREREYGGVRNEMTSAGLNINVAGMNLDGYLNEAQEMLSPRMSSPGITNGFGYRGGNLNDREMNPLYNSNQSINMMNGGMNILMGYERGQKIYNGREMEMGYGWMYNGNETQKMVDGNYNNGGFAGYGKSNMIVDGNYNNGGFNGYGKSNMITPNNLRPDTIKRPLNNNFFLEPKYETRIISDEYNGTNELICEDEPLDSLLKGHIKSPEIIQKKWCEKTWKGQEDTQFIGYKNINSRDRLYNNKFLIDNGIKPINSIPIINKRDNFENIIKTPKHKLIGALLVQNCNRPDLNDTYGKKKLEIVESTRDFLLLHGDAVLHRICMVICGMASSRNRRYITLEDIKIVFYKLFEATGINFHDESNIISVDSGRDFTEYNNIIKLIEKDHNNC